MNRTTEAVRPHRGEPFFLAMGLVLIATVLAGFVPFGLSQPGGFTAVPFLLHVHGAVFLSWYVLFCVQASMVRSGNLQLHRRLGQCSVALAAAMILMACLVMRHAYARPDFSIAGLSGANSIIFPFTDMINFTIAYVLAIANRARPETHKRWMLLTCVLMIDPAVARIVITLGLPAPVIVALELALFAAIIVYDLRTRRRPHWATICGLGLYALAMAAKFSVAHQPGWARFVDSLLG